MCVNIYYVCVSVCMYVSMSEFTYVCELICMCVMCTCEFVYMYLC